MNELKAEMLQVVVALKKDPDDFLLLERYQELDREIALQERLTVIPRGVCEPLEESGKPKRFVYKKPTKKQKINFNRNRGNYLYLSTKHDGRW